jgi:hypothetical protein
MPYALLKIRLKTKKLKILKTLKNKNIRKNFLKKKIAVKKHKER